MSDKRESNVIRGNFRPPQPGVSSPFDLQLREEVEQRADGPWLVVYAYGKKMGEVPIKPGTEPKVRRAKVLALRRGAPSDDDRSPSTDTRTDL